MEGRFLGAAQLVAFVPTGDLAASHAFYGGVLGLDRLEESGFANAYDVGGTQLRVTRVARAPAAAHTVAGWWVDDIVAVVGALRSAGVAMVEYDGMAQDTDGVWTAPGGARVAWFRDPDANVLSLTQPAR